MPTTRAALGGVHLLIIDDNPDQLRLLVELLRGTGYRLSVAFDGIQGYDRALALLPDLIMLDVRMPRMDGFALCRRLKANPVTAHIPIIFLTLASDLTDRLTGLRDGGVDYILKPYEADEVLARIQIHLELAGKKPAFEAGAEETMHDDEVLIRAAKRHLQLDLALPPRLDELAAALGVSERRLSRVFRKRLNTTVFGYLRQERMRMAERLLTQTSLSMVAISQEVGFSSPANFSTAFREYAGVSPSDFRRTASGFPSEQLPLPHDGLD